MIRPGDRVPIVDDRIRCPNCQKKKLLTVLPSTRGWNIPLYCNRCGAVSVCNIAPGPSATLVEIVPRGGA